MFTLEMLPAKHGDALLLHFGSRQLAVIDGGPATVYSRSLKPRLDRLRAERRLGDKEPLDIELMMVSHIDADHITGILELVQTMKDLQDSREFVPWRIRRFWHNSFDDAVAHGGGAAVAGASAGAADAFAASADVFAASATLTPASVKQGRDLAKLLAPLKLGGNKPFRGLVQFGKRLQGVTIGPLTLTVVGPNEDNLRRLRDDWAKKVVDLIRKETDRSKAAAVVADYVDKSPYNLSSIVVLAACDGRTMLLTGDGRGDHTLDELEKAGLFDRDGTLTVDLLKLPHHGSSRNVRGEYFERIKATHYVISADGRHSNPDVETLELISSARPDDRFTIYLSYQFDEFTEPAIGREVKKFFDSETKKGRQYKVVTPAAGEGSVSIAP